MASLLTHICNFYPRPPRGGRQLHSRLVTHCLEFLPTPSARRATGKFVFDSVDIEFLPTPSARRATALGTLGEPHGAISTHALREEGDRPAERGHRPEGAISTHALREEGDIRAYNNAAALTAISTHALREEGDALPPVQDVQALISTHALREEGDGAHTQHRQQSLQFLPTPSARRATIVVTADMFLFSFLPTPSARRATVTFSSPLQVSIRISTHALREEGDPHRAPDGALLGHFYPRPPRGGRH